MTPEQQQANYRRSCAYARKANVIFYAEDGKPGKPYKTFTRKAHHQGETIEAPAMNAAKKWVRENARFSTFVAD